MRDAIVGETLHIFGVQMIRQPNAEQQRHFVQSIFQALVDNTEQNPNVNITKRPLEILFVSSYLIGNITQMYLAILIMNAIEFRVMIDFSMRVELFIIHTSANVRITTY
jgi:hypothetical protein